MADQERRSKQDVAGPDDSVHWGGFADEDTTAHRAEPGDKELEEREARRATKQGEVEEDTSLRDGDDDTEANSLYVGH